MSNFPWSALGIEETRDQSVIRKAYSAKLKTMNLDEQIQEYAELRQARDIALQIARQPLPQDLPTEDEADDYDDGQYDDFDDYEYDELYIDGYGGGLGASYPRGPVIAEGWEDPGQPQEVDQELVDAWKSLEKIVFPGGQQSDDAMDAEEYAFADTALRLILDRAGTGDINQFNAVDYNLSEIMAAGWPRSAPLVDAANDEFHWIGDAGQLIERPALQFLNARIVGMRFNDEVLDPKHRYNKAWMDLSGADTTPVFLKRWWLKRDTVFELLGLIRGNYPELEYLLDGERIQKWENSTNSSIARIIQWIALIYFAFAFLGYCADQDRQSVEEVMAEDRAGPLIDAAIAEVLGEEWNREKLFETDSAFATQFSNATTAHLVRTGEVDEATAVQEARDFTRRQMLAARESAEFDDLLAIQQAYLALLRTARADELEQCRSMLVWDDLTPFGLESRLREEQQEAERALMVNLLEKGLMLESVPTGPRSVAIPGWVIEGTMNSSGLSEEQVRTGLRQSNDPNRCRVMTGLMETIARSPGRVEAELLRWP